jgi:hypothetical protein
LIRLAALFMPLPSPTILNALYRLCTSLNPMGIAYLSTTKNTCLLMMSPTARAILTRTVSSTVATTRQMRQAVPI